MSLLRRNARIDAKDARPGNRVRHSHVRMSLRGPYLERRDQSPGIAGLIQEAADPSTIFAATGILLKETALG
jgi:hypothetical protein